MRVQVSFRVPYGALETEPIDAPGRLDEFSDTLRHLSVQGYQQVMVNASPTEVNLGELARLMSYSISSGEDGRAGGDGSRPMELLGAVFRAVPPGFPREALSVSALIDRDIVRRQYQVHISIAVDYSSIAQVIRPELRASRVGGVPVQISDFGLSAPSNQQFPAYDRANDAFVDATRIQDQTMLGFPAQGPVSAAAIEPEKPKYQSLRGRIGKKP